MASNRQDEVRPLLRMSLAVLYILEKSSILCWMGR